MKTLFLTFFMILSAYSLTPPLPFGLAEAIKEASTIVMVEATQKSDTKRKFRVIKVYKQFTGRKQVQTGDVITVAVTTKENARPLAHPPAKNDRKFILFLDHYNAKLAAFLPLGRNGLVSLFKEAKLKMLLADQKL